MIETVKRETVFKNLNNIGYEISALQRALYDSSIEFDSIKDKEDYLKCFDAVDLKFRKPVVNVKTISICHNERNKISTFTKLLQDKIFNLFEHTGQKDFYVLSHLKMNLLGSNNKNPALKTTFNRLKKIIGKEDFSDALKIDIENIGDMAKVFFKIALYYDISAPEYIFFATLDDKLSFNICKYGNLHFMEYDNCNILNQELLDSLNLFEIAEC